jgi:hypothetical protein
MSDRTGALRAAFRIHGTELAVAADDPAVIAAMQLRLHAFDRNGSAPADVRMEFLHERETGTGPSAPGRPVYDTPDGSLYYAPESDLLYGRFGGVTLRCEPARGLARLTAARFTERDLYLATHPLATVCLMELLERRRLFSLHAACVADEAGHGVLLSGPSGCGKSTLTLALVRLGMRFLSDDVVFLSSAGDGGVRARGVADTIGLTHTTAARFADLSPRLTDPPDRGFPKRLGRIEDLFGVTPHSACVPRAIVFPEVAPNSPSAVTALDPREALLRLVPDVLLTDAVSTQAHLAAVSALLAQVSCYAVASGFDLDRAAELVAGLV